MRKGWKRVHRLVVLPDYQGIGIGRNFINAIAKYYCDRGWVMNLTTTTPSLVHGLVKDKHWTLKRYGRSNSKMQAYQNYYDSCKSKHLTKAQSNKRVTYSFFYKD